MEPESSMDNNKPYFNDKGDLIIPFECADHEIKYWKKEGRPIEDILRELDADQATWEKYSGKPFSDKDKQPEKEED